MTRCCAFALVLLSAGTSASPAPTPPEPGASSVTPEAALEAPASPADGNPRRPPPTEDPTGQTPPTSQNPTATDLVDAATESAAGNSSAEPKSQLPQVVTRRGEALGTQIEVQVYSDQPQAAAAAGERALLEFKRVEALLSERRRSSDVFRLNKNAGGSPVTVAVETVRILRRGKAFHSATEGAFALTLAAIAPLWDFRAGIDPALPESERVTALLPLINDDDLVVDSVAQTAALARTGMAVGLDAVLKGYAIDRALDILESEGFDQVLVFAGGDLAVRGTKGDRPWVIGLQDPRAEGHYATLPLDNGAVAVSGDYERFFELGGKRYHPILNPQTGFPAEGCRSVAVVAAEAFAADALATAVFVLGPQRGLALVESMEGIEAVIVTAENQVVLSPGLRSQVRLLREPTP